MDEQDEQTDSVESVTMAANSWRHLIDIRFPDSRCFAIGYPQVLWVSATKTSMILHCATHTLHFHGRGLLSLYDGVVRQVVSKIQLVTQEQDIAKEQECVVHHVDIFQKEGAKAAVPSDPWKSHVGGDIGPASTSNRTVR